MASAVTVLHGAHERGDRGGSATRGVSLGRAHRGLPRQEDRPREFPSLGRDLSNAQRILVLGRIAELKSMGSSTEIRE